MVYPVHHLDDTCCCQCLLHGKLFILVPPQPRNTYAPFTRQEHEYLSPLEDTLSWPYLMNGSPYFTAYDSTSPSARCRNGPPRVEVHGGNAGRGGPAARPLHRAPGGTRQPPSPSVRLSSSPLPATNLVRKFHHQELILM